VDRDGLERLTVDHIRVALAPYGLTVRELFDDTSTAVLAAEALDTSVGSIVKSLLFDAGEESVLLLVAGDRKVDARALGRELGVSKVRLAKPDAVIAITGYAVGGVPPVGHKTRLRTLLDRALLEYDTVYAAAGTPNAIFAVQPERLRDITGAEITDATLS
jgi:Cys-tRNA(Pro) deacylase